MPSRTDAYWSECQHGSWYFLPWHRGYLIAFEAVVRRGHIPIEMGLHRAALLPFLSAASCRREHRISLRPPFRNRHRRDTSADARSAAE
jgi:hypothetical protein